MMEIGESLVAAYMRHVRGCDLILTNVHLSDIQGELDVIGLERSEPQRLWLCEVTTHIRGMNNPTKRTAAQRAIAKIDRAVGFASDVFPNAEPHFEIWSPIVRPGLITELDSVVAQFEARGIALAIVANKGYTQRLQALVECARKSTADTGNDAFRMLQILTRVKGGLQL
jgi:hypothetical protein